MPDPVDPQDDKFIELTAALKHSLFHHQFKAGQILQQIREEQVYGHWGTFADYVSGELRLTESQAYRWMWSYEIAALLEKHRCRRPINERQIRSLHLLKSDKLQVLAWNRACEQKQDTGPTYMDVNREVRRLLPKTADPDTDTRFRKFRQHLESARAEYARAHQILEDNELEDFFACTDKKSRRQRQAVIKTIEKLTIQLGGDLLEFMGADENPEE